MNELLATAIGAGIGIGLYLLYLGIRGAKVLPSPSSILPSSTAGNQATAWLVGALVAGGAVLVVTGWPGAAFGAFCLTVSIPWFVLNNDDSDMDRIEAVATWTEMIRDNLAGAAGLEQAIAATSELAPEPIATEVRSFSRLLDRMSLPDALESLGRDLNVSSADLVVVALTNAARMESGDLGPLLTRLSDSIRADVRMRQRIEVGRSRVRTSTRIVLAVTLLTMAVVYATSAPLLEYYDTLAGQIWLVGIFGIFVGSLWMMERMAVIEVPERFSARPATRHRRSETPLESGSGKVS